MTSSAPPALIVCNQIMKKKKRLNRASILKVVVIHLARKVYAFVALGGGEYVAREAARLVEITYHFQNFLSFFVLIIVYQKRFKKSIDKLYKISGYKARIFVQIGYE